MKSQKEVNTKIRYVSLPPGSGKTSGAIEFMRRNIVKSLTKSNLSKIPYVLYVAPTIQLLTATKKRLMKKLSKVESKKVQFFHSDNDESIFGSKTVREKIHNYLLSNDFQPGSVLFITHASFLNLSRYKKFSKTVVLFDEARKWVSNPVKLQLSDSNIDCYLNSLFTLENTTLFSVKKMVPKKKVNQSLLTQNKKHKGEVRKLTDLYDKLKSQRKVTRIEAYAVWFGQSTLIQLTVPSVPFRGFKIVYILSADFENSQMYHLLKRDKSDIQLQDYSDEFVGRYVPNLARTMIRLNQRQRSLTLVPLLNLDMQPATKHRKLGLIVTYEQVRKLSTLMDKFGIPKDGTRFSIVRSCVSYLKSKNKNQLKPIIIDKPYFKSIVKYIKKNCEYDVESYWINSAKVLAKIWFNNHPKLHEDGDGLLLVNNKVERKFSLKGNPYLDYIFWDQVEGNNEYRDRSLIGFLSSLNPSSPEFRMLNVVIPEYDAELDHVVDKAVQVIGRGNIRKHKSKKPMLAIVPTLRLSERIKSRMKGRPTIDTSWLEQKGYPTLWYKEPVNLYLSNSTSAPLITDEIKLLRKKNGLKTNSTIFKAKVGTEYSTLTVRMYRLKKKLKEDPENSELLFNLEKVKQELEELKLTLGIKGRHQKVW